MQNYYSSETTIYLFFAFTYIEKGIYVIKVCISSYYFYKYLVVFLSCNKHMDLWMVRLTCLIVKSSSSKKHGWQLICYKQMFEGYMQCIKKIPFMELDIIFIMCGPSLLDEVHFEDTKKVINCKLKNIVSAIKLCFIVFSCCIYYTNLCQLINSI